jgi:hypothetical protein
VTEPSHTYLIHPARAIREDPNLLPAGRGLYGFLLNDAAALQPSLSRWGLGLDGLQLGGRPIIYLGASADSLRRRVPWHLKDDTQSSTFRASLGALLADELRLELRPSGGPLFAFTPPSEARLTNWIFAHISVVLREAPRPLAREARLIRKVQPLLNIAGRHRSDSAWTLLLLRRRCRSGALDVGA